MHARKSIALSEVNSIVDCLDPRQGSIARVATGVLPARFFGPPAPVSSVGMWGSVLGKEPQPRVLQLLPTDCDVQFSKSLRSPHLNPRPTRITRKALCLALVEHPGGRGPVLDAFVGNDGDGGGILASMAYDRSRVDRWDLIPKGPLLQIPKGVLTANMWNDADDHSKGEADPDAVQFIRFVGSGAHGAEELQALVPDYSDGMLRMKDLKTYCNSAPLPLNLTASKLSMHVVLMYAAYLDLIPHVGCVRVD